MLEKELEDYKIKAYCSSSASHELKEQLTENLVTDKIDYETDEDQLAADTDSNWIVKTSNKFNKSKKRKLNNTLTTPNQQQQQQQKQHQQKSKNAQNVVTKSLRALLPPPIIIEEIKDYNEMHNIIKKALMMNLSM